MELLASYRRQRCVVCSKTPCDPAHIKTVKSGGDDVYQNIVSLCRKCHSTQHTMGIISFALKYPRMRAKLESLGWEIDTFRMRLWHKDIK